MTAVTRSDGFILFARRRLIVIYDISAAVELPPAIRRVGFENNFLLHALPLAVRPPSTLCLYVRIMDTGNQKTHKARDKRAGNF